MLLRPSQFLGGTWIYHGVQVTFRYVRNVECLSLWYLNPFVFLGEAGTPRPGTPSSLRPGTPSSNRPSTPSSVNSGELPATRVFISKLILDTLFHYFKLHRPVITRSRVQTLLKSWNFFFRLLYEIALIAFTATIISSFHYFKLLVILNQSDTVRSSHHI